MWLRAAESEQTAFTLKEALRTPIFFVLTVGTFMYTFTQSGVFFHLSSIMGDRGLGTDSITALYYPFGFVTAGASLLVSPPDRHEAADRLFRAGGQWTAYGRSL